MSDKHTPLACYIGAIVNSEIEPYLEERKFSHGLVIFSIPDYGILFRCRAEGDDIDLEFASLFSLLKFLKTRLSNQKLTSILLHSSNPEFVFSFRPNSKHLTPGSTREKMLKEYLVSLQLQVTLIDPQKNRAFQSPADYPSMPADRPSILKPTPADIERSEFKPFQRGIKL
ncbi:MAG: hypothetical protein IPH75_15085 [bacterium]|nr:hypothetical protein [bacterium]